MEKVNTVTNYELEIFMLMFSRYSDRDVAP